MALRQVAGATKPPAQQVGITPAIENRVDVHAALVQQVVEGKRKTPDQHAVKAIHLEVDTGIKRQGLHFSLDRVEKAIAESRALALVKEPAVA
jgi:alanine racemase